MNINIRDIIKVSGCTDMQAAKIESIINRQALLDWSECEMEQIEEAVFSVLYEPLERVDELRSEMERDDLTASEMMGRMIARGDHPLNYLDA